MTFISLMAFSYESAIHFGLKVKTARMTLTGGSIPPRAQQHARSSVSVAASYDGRDVFFQFFFPRCLQVYEIPKVLFVFERRK